ncbi:hypothetical protein FOC1_g10001612 [Fusarium oxysporum f. sp. cubense race 1]|uniref:C2H2-type domain-containing protein n=1 Tax=Fusarium oxysporum f. sp. cubense (strain race 1) TaxID=1229664 RepID=N4V3L3_FUSC1|nr:hypothetical protein FOC1_g10001612 [Fusarium oxysporum f. sp. cubense race 1]
MKRSRSGRSLYPPENHSTRPEGHSARSPSKGDGLLGNSNDEITGTNENQKSRENSPDCSHFSSAQEMNLQNLLRGRFSRWSDGVEYHMPPEDRLPPRKRFRTSQCQSSLPRTKEQDDSEVSHPARTKGFFHLACPFYIHAPDKYQNCLAQQDLNSIEVLIKHLLRHHSRPLYCRICRKTFKTLIDRDNHMLENACKANNQKSLEGLTENQKVSLIKGDKYYLGETTRWSRIWSTVFADIEQPRSPYLDRGDGLKVSMIRDFWDSDGHEFVSKFIAGLESHVNWNSARHHMILKEVSDGLLSWAMKPDSESTILP